MASTNSALRRIGANRTLGAMVDFSADYEAPGLLVRGREGGLYVGELDAQMTARVEVARELMSYSTPTRATCNVMGYVWSKLCKGTMDATTALVDADIGEVRGNRATQQVLVEIVREGLLVAAAEGIHPERFDAFVPKAFLDTSEEGLANACRVLDSMPVAARRDLKARTGYWRDIVVRKRPSEIAYITGEIVERGARLGVPIPVNKRQLELFADIEGGRRPMTWENLDELDRAMT